MYSHFDASHETHALYARAGGLNPNNASRPPVYKVIGICLAVASGLFIGVSFVVKKVGLLKANVKYNEEAGEGYGYLKNLWWWSGMIIMIVGELCNLAAYGFVDAILVTPFGALSVVVTTILSAIFLKERLSFVGKVGCFICIIGSVVIAVNAPEQSSVATIQQMQEFVIAPGFLTFAGVVLVVCAVVALWAGPRYGKKTMMVYLTVCSLTGGLSVVATQGFGAAVIAQASGTPQFNQWFLYVLLVFLIATLLVEIIYLNKALNIYNAALVTPTYYVYFTSATIVSSMILFRGFKGKPTAILTVIMGFLQICSGVILLQLSKSAKDVPDTAVFAGDLDQVRTVAEQEQPETEPKADAIRGTAALIRRISVSRQKMEAEEARRLHEDRMRELEPVREGEQFEWDGIRRRRTMSTRSGATGSLHRQKTIHPPLGMSHMPSEIHNDEQGRSSGAGDEGGEHGMFSFIRSRTPSIWRKALPKTPDHERPPAQGAIHNLALAEMSVPASSRSEATTAFPQFVDGPDPSGRSWMTASPVRENRDQASALSPRPPSSDDGISGRPRGPSLRWAPEVRVEGGRSPGPSPVPPRPPPHTAKRQFSFQNIFTRPKDRHQTHDGATDDAYEQQDATQSRPRSRLGLGSRQSSHSHTRGSLPFKAATEEERLGLVQGDSSSKLNLPEYASDDEDDDWRGKEKALASGTTIRPALVSSSPSSSDSDDPQRRKWDDAADEKGRALYDGYYSRPHGQRTQEGEDRKGRERQHTPSSSSSSTVTTTSTTRESNDDDGNDRAGPSIKEWESRSGGAGRGGGRGSGGAGGGGNTGAFI